jgi:hypothetical protein
LARLGQKLVEQEGSEQRMQLNAIGRGCHEKALRYAGFDHLLGVISEKLYELIASARVHECCATQAVLRMTFNSLVELFGKEPIERRRWRNQLHLGRKRRKRQHGWPSAAYF